MPPLEQFAAMDVGARIATLDALFTKFAAEVDLDLPFAAQALDAADAVHAIKKAAKL